MGYIREPEGVNFVVRNKPITQEDKELISNAIAYYKSTGKIRKLKGDKKQTNQSKNA